MNKYIGRSALVPVAVLIAVSIGSGAHAAMAAPHSSTAPSVSVAYQTERNHHVSKLPKIATEWQAAWNSTDVNALAALFTADGVYIDNGVGKTSVGTAQITNWKATTDYLIAGVHLDVISAHRHRNTVIIHSQYSGHIKGAPHSFSIPGKTILELRHGKIAVNTDNYDGALLLSQSGLPADWTPGS
jgi:ketosteroid isomerase-like protein